MKMQMKKPRYLTKSRFKLATECPTKLYYSGKKEYANQKQENSFLLALAEGGFQVGELAKLYFPGGNDITTLDYDEAVQQTEKKLSLLVMLLTEFSLRLEGENRFLQVKKLRKAA